jgi:TctA family transporter
MLVEHLALALTLLLGIAIANMIGGIITFFMASRLARIAGVRLVLLFPLILVFVMSGGYIVRDTMLNIVLILFLGVFGLLMKRNGYSRPALILGFVLGDLFEKYSLLSIKIFGPFFFISPISLTLIAILVLVLFFPLLRKTLPKLIRRPKKA